MDKYHNVVITKIDDKIFAVVRGLCAHAGTWQEYYRQDITEVVSLVATAPQNTIAVEEKKLQKELKKQFKALSDHNANFDKFMDNFRKTVHSKKKVQPLEEQDKQSSKLYSKCVFLTDCKNKYRGHVPPCSEIGTKNIL